MMRKFLVFGLLLLSGCGLSDYYAAGLRAQDDEQCQSFGAKQGSDSYVNCMATLAQRDATEGEAGTNGIDSGDPCPACTARLQNFINR